VLNNVRNRDRKGVASTMLADRLEPGSSLRVFTQPSHGFTIPADSNAPMIMVGPGTGIAPFIAFLQQREADKAQGRNWLFFGDQRSATDFLYREQLESWRGNELLTHLDLAFSRDNENKVYVQHRMKDRGAELFQWLESGAYFFVCGDASKMAIDVDKALLELIAEHGKKTLADARVYLTAMATAKRYCRDVY
jgi:sulfite reductase (NADPH) flavoprotein alpha-component